MDAAALRRRRDALVALLADAIEGNASVGYVLPLDRPRLEAYWNGIAAEVEAGERVVFACVDGDRIAGSVQLAPCMKPNQPHRADVQKLLVLRSHRGRGIASALMRSLEAHARETGRWLLLLDTRTGSEADALYQRWRWQALGVVPQFALDPDGTMADCTFYWKHLR
jgi:GNAT superfamily N-acetyltransferase